ncbi:MAG TPA: hypothetical protein VIM53_02835 [Candidatus Saccharimonadales bacterium]
MQRQRAWQALTKVPKLTAFFWAIKILTTGMGEAVSDYLTHHVNPFVAVFIGFVGFVVAMAVQFSRKKYVPWAYWLAASMVAIFGTMAADGLHIQFGVPYIASAIFYAFVLAAVFSVWHKSEGTLAIHSIHTPKRETFYWLAVLSTFAMGTALGDLTANTFGLGYFASGILFTAIFAAPAITFWIRRANPVLTFWLCYIITRPLGASFADWAGVPKSFGGLNLGRGTVSLALIIIIAILVGIISVTRADAQSKEA